MHKFKIYSWTFYPVQYLHIFIVALGPFLIIFLPFMSIYLKFKSNDFIILTNRIYCLLRKLPRNFDMFSYYDHTLSYHLPPFEHFRFSNYCIYDKNYFWFQLPQILDVNLISCIYWCIFFKNDSILSNIFNMRLVPSGIFIK